ncbi:class I SAM-dependent methyltransferase [Micromonospora siamensis]|uniref:Methyltransferase domain-containing protein n=1 Tax=Micromonospora siamensis TaxID=299152 RepID=A0A1C5HGU7_9ACTN|nr:class I SAM-dependent methyltransferase [Micromonospora siamensis]SCG45143.1 Methyltransferase domain-containing protein [Micromonospora siamensis]
MPATDEGRGTAGPTATSHGGTLRPAFGSLGSLLVRRDVAVATVAAVALAVVAATLLGAGATTVLLVAAIGLVLLAALHSHRQNRLVMYELRRRVGQLDHEVTRLVGRFDTTEQQHEQIRAEVRHTTETVEAITLDPAVERVNEYMKRVVVRETGHTYREVESLLNLYSMITVEGRVPPMRGWAASPDVLLLLVDLVRTERPGLIVECGSGVSTLWCSLALRQFGVDGRVVSLEHDEAYARQTNKLLAEHGVSHLAEARHAPLEEFDLGDHSAPWYSRRAWADLDRIGLLFVDGPPGTTAGQARYPALPLLADRLAANAAVVMDDTVRRDEQDIIKQWLTDVPTLTEERFKLEKGASVLRAAG